MQSTTLNNKIVEVESQWEWKLNLIKSMNMLQEDCKSIFERKFASIIYAFNATMYVSRIQILKIWIAMIRAAVASFKLNAD